MLKKNGIDDDISPQEYMIRVRGIREGKNMTQMQVADELGTSQTMYSRYERGATELPVRHLISLCKLFDVSADYLLGLSPTETRDEEYEEEDYEDEDSEDEEDEDEEQDVFDF